jgi:hypothetical protein
MPEAKSKPRTKQQSGASSATTSPAVSGQVSVSPEQRYHMIAEAAYFHAEQRGFAGGDPAQDWLEAEAEIDRILQSGAVGTGPGATPKQAFQAALETQLRELDARLEELKLKSTLASMELRSEYEKQLEILNSKRSVAQAKLNELRNRAEDAWEDLKGGTEKAWEDMRQALERMVARFK